ncbi:Uncharacterized protein BP5553_09372 [Venustampulla echinocandica]|uniref:Mitochondrial intermembrane space import and assembly protein 40 n=1 Tax=Venustampulla echinocandica TaxID=2656787 RepID=A0A370TCH7_9HELO|nr:Uncharacterized protein BP5553_09372 [Venustampulla echinocandica]RDL31970.1 Uncharacterized protein BP5553_09372 [Venustampulla echinocandica]
MFRSAVQAAPRRLLPIRSVVKSSPRRFISTTRPSQKSGSWKGSAARWALAGGAVYYYNTSNVFAEEPEAAVQRLDETINNIKESDQPTVDAIVEEKRRRAAERAAEEERRERAAEAAAEKGGAGGEEEGEGGLDDLEGEADAQGAFNPETGEINWDCPCLGGMAHGPCGEEFRAAFSCFVYSKEDPKGVECIDKFKGMQDCFRQHPEMYGSELDDDEDEVEEELRARQHDELASQSAPESKEGSDSTADEPTADEPANQPSVTSVQERASAVDAPGSQPSPNAAEGALTGTQTTADEKEPTMTYRDSRNTKSGEAQKAGDEYGELIPKAASDASSK